MIERYTFNRNETHPLSLQEDFVHGVVSEHAASWFEDDSFVTFAQKKIIKRYQIYNEIEYSKMVYNNTPGLSFYSWLVIYNIGQSLHYGDDDVWKWVANAHIYNPHLKLSTWPR